MLGEIDSLKEKPHTFNRGNKIRKSNINILPSILVEFQASSEPEC